MNLKEVQFIAPAGTEFGEVMFRDGVLTVTARRPGEEWPHGIEPARTLGSMAEGYTRLSYIDPNDERPEGPGVPIAGRSPIGDTTMADVEKLARESAERVAKATAGPKKMVKVAVDGVERFVECDAGLTAADLTSRLAAACRTLYGPGSLSYRDDCYHYATDRPAV